MTDTSTRPDVDAVLQAALRSLHERSAAPVVFGGVRHGDIVGLDCTVGALTDALTKVRVSRGCGLGGAAWHRRRPTAVDDYLGSSLITHHYDGAVRRERLTSILVAPIFIGADLQGLVYAGIRDGSSRHDRLAAQVRSTADEVEVELRVRAEVERRVSVARAALIEGSSREREHLRTVYAELRALAARRGDRALTRDVDQILTHTAAGPSGTGLTARQVDVLALVALGCTNVEVARRLDLSPDTVKNYLGAAMHRLGASSRHEAVVLARRSGVLP